jgi:hypothetical protein
MRFACETGVRESGCDCNGEDKHLLQFFQHFAYFFRILEHWHSSSAVRAAAFPTCHSSHAVHTFQRTQGATFVQGTSLYFLAAAALPRVKRDHAG